MKKVIYLIIYSLGFLLSCSNHRIEPDFEQIEVPRIFPDYTNVVFPPNIAPPNFAVEEKADLYYVEIGLRDEKPEIQIKSKNPEIIIPTRKWKNLLAKAKGNDIYFTVYIKKDDKWTKFAPIKNSISDEEIDSHLVYRLIYPGYSLWKQMGIYQRDITSYRQTAVIENKTVGLGCVNCHNFANNSPETMLLHIRGEQGGTVIVRDGKSTKVDMKVEDITSRGTYPAWHPSGNFIAFSINEIGQFFHVSGQKPIEVVDRVSDLAIYDCENDEILMDSKISGKDFLETFPNWSPDGKELYFCRADSLRNVYALDSIYYDLYKIGFNPDTKEFGDTVCVLKVSDKNKSISFPRVSPDGNYLMFVVSDYGNFSIWHPESDLYLLNLSTNEVRRMDEVNSNDVESYHTWSSSGKWFVFSSKRMDGLWARPYFAYFDSETGMASKPFVLPQKDPYFYDKFTKTFNIPELITEPIKNTRVFK